MNQNPSKALHVTGGRKLKGNVQVRGAKNLVPKAIIASLLTKEIVTITNVAFIRDVQICIEILRAMGVLVEYNQESGTIRIDPANAHQLDYEQTNKFSGISRIPILLSAPSLHRFGSVVLPILGGCNIGPRPINFHLDALFSMGAQTTEKSQYTLLSSKRLKGTKINLPYPSVGATEQCIFAAVLAEGITEIKNCAVEPEIIDLICMLQKMGAKISIKTDRTIIILGVELLNGCEHRALTDRLEVASWACTAAGTNGEIFVNGANQVNMMSFLDAFMEIGGGFQEQQNGMLFYRKSKQVSPIVLQTNVHPGFMTDWQQPFSTILTLAEGVSVIHETVYEDRFGYTAELNEMGANIQIHKECLGESCRFGRQNHLHSALIIGPTKLKGKTIRVPDLRGGFAYLIAGLIAEGNSILENASILERGYENLFEKLISVGADVALH